MYRGDTLQIQTQVVRDAVSGQLSTCVPNQLPPGAVPQDLTGYHVQFTAKYFDPDPDNKAVFLLDNQGLGGVTILDVTLGKVQAVGQPIATIAFPDGDVPLVYDVQLVDGGGVVTTVETGTLTVSPDVTRAIS